MDEFAFFATAPKATTDLLARELASFGAHEIGEQPAGVAFKGSLEVAYRACLESRIANRVLLSLASFGASTTDELYEQVKSIDWNRHVDAGGTIAVDANVSSSQISHSHYAALRIKDAIVDTFFEAKGTRPSVDVGQPDVRINAHIHRDNVELSIDLSGTSLHQRGYRLDAGQAPLKENLAAAILLRARWPEMAADGRAFVDPMCGAGTLVLEAAMIAADIAPGLGRAYFGFLGWKGHHEAIWSRLCREAEHRREQGSRRLPLLMGFDRDRRILDDARENAARLGLEDHVRFAYQDIDAFRHDFPAQGLIATNPPYGRRLVATGELTALYRALGDVFKTNFQGWRAAVFTQDAQLGKAIGIRADRVNTLYNGAIACKLVHFVITEENFFRDDRLPARIAANELTEQSTAFRNRLTKNLRQLRRWAKREDIDCYRLYDADLPDYAAAIDLYGHAGSQTRLVCVQEYAAPEEIDERKAKRRIREIRTIVQDVLELGDEQLFFKVRLRQRGRSQYEKVGEDAEFYEVTEGPCHLLINFGDYLDTGLFLDHRPLRERIRTEADGKSFLNLFAYTGAATIHAALGGARKTTSVDMSRTYLDWAGRNLAANDLDTDAHSLVQADCLQWLQQCREQYDLIFLDPPSFSNSKRMETTLDVQRDHATLIGLAMQRLTGNGTLYFSTNLRSFKLDDSLGQDYQIEDITRSTIPFDFKRRQNIHHCFRVQYR